MLPIIGIIVVIACVLGGYVGMGGHLDVLWQPLEVVIIFGAGVGAFVISNRVSIIKHSLGALGSSMIKGGKYNKQSYEDMLCCLYGFLQMVKKEGNVKAEASIEAPESDPIFQKYPKVLADHHAMTMICDSFRMIFLGMDSPYQMDDLLTAEVDEIKEDGHAAAGAINGLGESLPALGIVAAVLGVIKAMGAISEPPEVLGGKIAAALVGTFLGIFLSYGIFCPLGAIMISKHDAEIPMFNMIRVIIVAYLHGMAPMVATEFGRRAVPEDVRPSFAALEEKLTAS